MDSSGEAQLALEEGIPVDLHDDPVGDAGEEIEFEQGDPGDEDQA